MSRRHAGGAPRVRLSVRNFEKQQAEEEERRRLERERRRQQRELEEEEERNRQERQHQRRRQELEEEEERNRQERQHQRRRQELEEEEERNRQERQRVCKQQEIEAEQLHRNVSTVGPCPNRSTDKAPENESARLMSVEYKPIGQPIVHRIPRNSARPRTVTSPEGKSYTRTLPNRYSSQSGRRITHRLVKTRRPCDLPLISEDRRSCWVIRELCEGACHILCASDRWIIPELPLYTDYATVELVARFVNFGKIQITNTTVIKLLAAANYIGFEELLHCCVNFVGGPDFPLELLPEIQDRFHHVDGLTDVFLERLNRLPLDIFHEKLSKSIEVLSLLTFQQLKLLLAADGLMVTHEDEAVKLILEWKIEHPINDSEMGELLDLIRYPMLSQKMARELRDSYSWRIPKHEFDTEQSCRDRKGYGFHLHFLWKEHRENERGPVSVGVSCVRWSQHCKEVVEERLFSSVDIRWNREEFITVDYNVIGDSVVRASFDEGRNAINVCEYDFAAGRSFKRRSLTLHDTRAVERPEYSFMKGTSDVAITYYDSGIHVMAVDRQTWMMRADRARDRLVANLPRNPREMQIFKDCVVVLSSQDIFICSNPTVSEYRRIEASDSDGSFTEFARVGDMLFVLEDFASQRRFCRRQVDRKPDLVRLIDIKEAVCVDTLKLPLLPEKIVLDHNHLLSAEPSKKFLQVGDELFAVIQNDSDKPLQIFRLSVGQQNKLVAELAAELPAPVPDAKDRKTLYTRAFKGVLPQHVIPCQHTRLIERRPASHRNH